ncbi:DUF6603 domain-containing protein [Shimia ponticola]|uniref:DUF6603 domain-containing protein n=1 Tax=Shimia ponticola TaxID=2582893 RepID=UPI0011BF84D8|nr:DUF6603 domain-containing protein [Shimia ponticola]
MTSSPHTSSGIEFQFELSANLVLGTGPVPLVLEFSRDDAAMVFDAHAPGLDHVTVATVVDALVEPDLAKTLPDVLRKIAVVELDVSGAPGGDFELLCAVRIELSGHHLLMRIGVGRTGGRAHLSGRLVLDGDPPLELEVHFGGDSSQTRFAASLLNANVDIRALVASVSKDLAEPIPQGLELKNALLRFAYESGEKDDDAKYLAAVDLGASVGMDWSELPLIGNAMPGDEGVSVDGLQLHFSNISIDAKEAQGWSALFPQTDLGSFLPTSGISSGVQLASGLRMGNRRLDLTLPLGGDTDDTHDAEAEDAKGEDPFFSLGPLDIDGVGLALRDSRVWVTFNATLSGGGLHMGLDGLGLGFKLDDLEHPALALDGISLAYSNPAVTISGDLLREVDPDGSERFAGAALLKTKPLTLSAVGAYEEIDGHTSLFLYAVLDRPIGGPPYFFVTGLAAGVGYNRRLIPPTIDQIEDFPLVAAAMRGKGDNSAEGGQKMLADLRTFLPASEDDGFIAVGVRFTTFEIIESFALVTVGFGHKLEGRLLGVSTLETPPKSPTTPPLARIRIGLIADIEPDALLIDGRVLDGSFLFSPDCKLSGGFAFYSWFAGKHSGDFVLTVGGFHPEFEAPDHYPNVSRIRLNWQVTPELSLKGSYYYGLTGAAVMAGGNLSAVYRSGSFKAWFRANANFIAVWEPFAYDAKIEVTVGASYTFESFGLSKSFEGEVSAKLHIWGPEFAVHAEVDIGIKTFVIEHNGHGPVSAPLGWTDFSQKFLPKSEQVCSIVLKSGLLRTVSPNGATDSGEDIWVVSAKDLCLSIESAIPASRVANLQSWIEPEGHDLTFAHMGIRPMGKSNRDVESDLTVMITQPSSGNFVLRDIRKRVPLALWGAPQAGRPAANDPRYLDGALCGVELRSAKVQDPDATASLDGHLLSERVKTHAVNPNWAPRDMTQSAELASGTRREMTELSADLLHAFDLGVASDT